MPLTLVEARSKIIALMKKSVPPYGNAKAVYFNRSSTNTEETWS